MFRSRCAGGEPPALVAYLREHLIGGCPHGEFNVACLAVEDGVGDGFIDAEHDVGRRLLGSVVSAEIRAQARTQVAERGGVERQPCAKTVPPLHDARDYVHVVFFRSQRHYSFSFSSLPASWTGGAPEGVRFPGKRRLK